MSGELSMKHLAKVLTGDENQVIYMKEHDGKYCLIDITLLIAGKNRRYTAEQLRILRQQYPEVDDNIVHCKFAGRRQVDTPVGDINVFVEIIMLLPGIRAEAARLFVKYYGGDEGTAAEPTMHVSMGSGLSGCILPMLKRDDNNMTDNASGRQMRKLHQTTLQPTCR